MHKILVYVKVSGDAHPHAGFLQTEDENHFFDACFALPAVTLLVQILRAAGITAEVVNPQGNGVKIADR